MHFPTESLHLLHRFNPLTLQVIVDITTHIFHRGSCDIHLNHGDLLDAIWSWAGIKAEHRRKVAEVWLLLVQGYGSLYQWFISVSWPILFPVFQLKLLSMMGSLRPQSS